MNHTCGSRRLKRALAIGLMLCIVPAASLANADDATPALVELSAARGETLTATHCTVAFNDTGVMTIRAADAGKAEVSIAAKGHWDLSGWRSLEIALRNTGKGAVTIRAKVSGAEATGLMNSCSGAIELLAGESKPLTLRLTRRPMDPTYKVFEKFYMYYKAMNVRDNTIDPTDVRTLTISISGAAPGQSVEVVGIAKADRAASPTTNSWSPESFFPFVDTYGQYAHSDWPGKIYTDADFAERRKQEAAERIAWPGPGDWDKYGGWAAGPLLKATGHFYATKHEGKWWFVDPDGRLFWSYGPTGVGFGGDVTPVTDREQWFAELPARDSEFGRFYRNGRGATYQYYQNRAWTGFDIQQANLFRKYGADYQKDVAEISHSRLRSWGYNSMGNWSAGEIYRMDRTPYTVAISYGSALIHFHMPDVFDPGWEPAVRARMERERANTANDPWNIGYFVDNERWFGWRPRAAAIGEETLKNPPERVAKIKFVEQLKAKYTKVEALNEAWGTTHETWDALLAFKGAPDMKNAKVLADCGDFGMLFAERYFSVCRDAVKKVAPDTLYLGSRFFGHTDPEVVKLASKYCDVISYNIYDNPPNGRVNQYAALDLPILSSEWGIESDHGQTPFRAADLKVQTPEQRANLMVSYAEKAMRHPNMIGAHFFQFRDQPLSGRPDGEATLRGLVNIADTPNFELIQANRRLAYKMYEIRSSEK